MGGKREYIRGNRGKEDGRIEREQKIGVERTKNGMRKNRRWEEREKNMGEEREENAARILGERRI